MTRNQNDVFEISQAQVGDSLSFLSRLSGSLTGDFNWNMYPEDKGYFRGFLSALVYFGLITSAKRDELSFYYHL